MREEKRRQKRERVKKRGEGEGGRERKGSFKLKEEGRR